MTDRFLVRREGGKDDYIETPRQVTYDTNLTLRRHIFFFLMAQTKFHTQISWHKFQFLLNKDFNTFELNNYLM